jgi:hypothetical protein
VTVTPAMELTTAIRGVLETHGPHLRDISDDTLALFASLMDAFANDCYDEIGRRRNAGPRELARRINDRRS